MTPPNVYRNAQLGFVALVFCVVCLPSPKSQAAFEFEADISGWEADGFSGSAGNDSQVFDLGPGTAILSVDYEVTFESFGGSYRSEFVLGLESLDGLSFWDALPAPDLDSSGTFSGSGSFNTDALGFFDPGGPFVLGDDGMLVVQVWDRDPDPATPDARVTSGRITISYAVPEPGSFLTLTALGGTLIWRRRRLV